MVAMCATGREDVFFRGERNQWQKDKHNCTIRLFISIAQVATYIYMCKEKSGVRLEWRRTKEIINSFENKNN